MRSLVATTMLRGFDVNGIQDRWDPRLESMPKRVNATLLEILGVGTPEYKKYSIAKFDAGLDSTFGDRFSASELREELRRAKIGRAHV